MRKDYNKVYNGCKRKYELRIFKVNTFYMYVSYTNNVKSYNIFNAIFLNRYRKMLPNQICVLIKPGKKSIYLCYVVFVNIFYTR